MRGSASLFLFGGVPESEFTGLENFQNANKKIKRAADFCH